MKWIRGIGGTGWGEVDKGDGEAGGGWMNIFWQDKKGIRTENSTSTTSNHKAISRIIM